MFLRWHQTPSRQDRIEELEFTPIGVPGRRAGRVRASAVPHSSRTASPEKLGDVPLVEVGRNSGTPSRVSTLPTKILEDDVIEDSDQSFTIHQMLPSTNQRAALGQLSYGANGLMRNGTGGRAYSINELMENNKQLQRDNGELKIEVAGLRRIFQSAAPDVQTLILENIKLKQQMQARSQDFPTGSDELARQLDNVKHELRETQFKLQNERENRGQDSASPVRRRHDEEISGYKEDLEQLHRKMEILKSQLATSQRSNEALKRLNANTGQEHSNQALERQLRDMNLEQSRLEAEAQDSRRQHAEATLNVENLQGEVDRLQRQLARSEQYVAELKENLDQAQAERANASSIERDLRTTQVQLEQKDLEIDDLRDKINRQAQEFRTQSSFKDDEQILALNSTIEALTAKNQSQNRELLDLRTHLGNSTASLNLARLQTEAARDESRNVKQKMEAGEAQLRKLTSELNDIKQRHRELQTQQSKSSSAEVNRLRARNESLESKARDYESQINSITFDLEAAKKKLEELALEVEHQRRHYSAQVDQLEAKLKLITRELDATRSGSLSEAEALRQLDRENKDSLAQILNLEAQIERLKSEREKLLLDFQTEKSRYDSLNSTRVGHDSQAKQLTLQVEKLRRELSTLHEAQDNSENEIRRLNMELNDARRALDRSKSAVENLQRRLDTSEKLRSDRYGESNDRMSEMHRELELENDNLRRHLDGALGLLDRLQSLTNVENPNDLEADLHELLDSNRILRIKLREVRSRLEYMEQEGNVREILQDDNENLSRRVRELLSSLADRDNERARLEVELTDLHYVLDQTELHAHSLERELTHLRLDLDRKLEQLTRLDSERQISTDTQRKITELNLSKSQDERLIKDLEQQLEAARLDANTYKERLILVQSSAKKDSKSDDAMTMLLEMDLKESHAKNKELEAQHNLSEATVRELERKIAELRAEILVSRSDAEAAKRSSVDNSDYKRLQDRIAELENVVALLNAYLARLKRRLGEKAEHIDSLTSQMNRVRLDAQSASASQSRPAESKMRILLFQLEYYKTICQKFANRATDLQNVVILTDAMLRESRRQREKDVLRMSSIVPIDTIKIPRDLRRLTFKIVAKFVLAQVRLRKRLCMAQQDEEKLKTLKAKIEREKVSLL